MSTESVALNDETTAIMVQHNEISHAFLDGEDEDAITGWIKALHFMSPDTSNIIPLKRLFRTNSGPQAYDIAHALDSGLITLSEARERIFRAEPRISVSAGAPSRGSKLQLLTRLDHNLVMAELSQYRTYEIQDEANYPLFKAYVSECHWLPTRSNDSSVCILTFTRL